MYFLGIKSDKKHFALVNDKVTRSEEWNVCLVLVIETPHYSH